MEREDSDQDSQHREPTAQARLSAQRKAYADDRQRGADQNASLVGLGGVAWSGHALRPGLSVCPHQEVADIAL